MKLKLIDPSFKNYTGYMGTVEFKDGVSVRDVTMVESNNIAALTHVNWIKNNKDIGRAKLVSVAFDDAVTAIITEKPKEPVKTEPVKKTKYSRADLEAVADKKGLAGLRAIAEEYGVKGKSINSLIEAIIDAQ